MLPPLSAVHTLCKSDVSQIVFSREALGRCHDEVGTVGKAQATNIRDPSFKSSHGHFLILGR